MTSGARLTLGHLAATKRTRSTTKLVKDDPISLILRLFDDAFLCPCQVIRLLPLVGGLLKPI